MKTRKLAVALTSLALVSSMGASAFASGNAHDNGLHNGLVKQQLNNKVVISTQTTFQFQDVSIEFGWAKNAIQKLSDEGIIKGFDKHHFKPNGKITRAQFASLLSRYFDLKPAADAVQDYKDVAKNTWFFNDIEAAKDYMTEFKDLQGGYDFKPDQPMTRAEAAVSLVQILVKENAVQLVSADQANQILSGFKDANAIPVNLRIHVATAIQNKVLQGEGNHRFNPNGTLNRAQAATLLFNLQTNVEVPPAGLTTSTTTTTTTTTEATPSTTTSTTTGTTAGTTTGTTSTDATTGTTTTTGAATGTVTGATNTTTTGTTTNTTGTTTAPTTGTTTTTDTTSANVGS